MVMETRAFLKVCIFHMLCCTTVQVAASILEACNNFILPYIFTDESYVIV